MLDEYLYDVEEAANMTRRELKMAEEGKLIKREDGSETTQEEAKKHLTNLLVEFDQMSQSAIADRKAVEDRMGPKNA